MIVKSVREAEIYFAGLYKDKLVCMGKRGYGELAKTFEDAKAFFIKQGLHKES